MARNLKIFSSINSSFYFKKEKKQDNKELQLNRPFFTFKKFDLPYYLNPNSNLCFKVLIFLLYQVLLLIDASFGFEMEIFEFLNVCQVHGFPKIIGVLTHLDLLKDNKSLKKTKKKLKTRFWTEVYQVHKLLYGLFAVLNNK